LVNRCPGFAKIFFWLGCLALFLSASAGALEQAQAQKFTKDLNRALKQESQSAKLKAQAQKTKNTLAKDELMLRAEVTSWQGRTIRQKLIQQVVQWYKIDIGNIFGEIAIKDLPAGEYCRAYPQRKVEIGRSAFLSPGFLAAVIMYANLRCGQIMEHAELKDSQQDAFDRLEATEAQINNADRLGLTAPEIRLLTQKRREIMKDLSYKNRRKAEINQYRVVNSPQEMEKLDFNDGLFSAYLEVEYLPASEAAEEILKLKIKNLLPRALTLEFPAGLIFIPREEQYESKIIYNPKTLELAPQGEKEIALSGFSLEVAKLPVPQEAKVTYRVINLNQLEEEPDDPINREEVDKIGKPNLKLYRNAQTLLKTGRELIANGKLKSYPGKNRQEAVIQQAIWLKSAPPGELAYPQIKEMIRLQVEAQKLTLKPEELEKTARDFWNEIIFLIKAANLEETDETAPGN